jgi:hypothetical protein
MKIKYNLSIKLLLLAGLLFLGGCSSTACGGAGSRDGSIGLCKKSLSF